jgi:hypothetical protein
VVIIALPAATPKSNKNTAKFALLELYNGTRLQEIFLPETDGLIFLSFSLARSQPTVGLLVTPSF